MKTSMKRKRSKKKTYVGWCTQELVEFLSCFGVDTKEPLDEAELVGVVKEYIKQKDLFRGDKKKFFLCDDKLRPLFTRTKVKYNMLHSKLRMHLAANADSEDEDDEGSEDDNGPLMKKKLQTNLEPNIDKRVSERHKRCFASLNQHNINLLYLRRSLVVTLLSHMDTFEQKVVGCFVRVRYHDGSYFPKKVGKHYQLGLVTGIKESKETYKVKDTCTNVLLCVAGFWDNVHISKLGDEDIEEDEYDDLNALVEKGYMKRATVGELEEKVAAVHTDIVNNWISRELRILDRRIDLANEKGWRQEFYELMDRQKLLSTPAERQRRLAVVPEIIADAEDEKETEVRITAVNSCLMNIEANMGFGGQKREIASCLVDMEEHSKEATQLVADSTDVPKAKPPKGVAEYAAESSEVVKEKPPEEANMGFGGKKMERASCLVEMEENSKEATQLVADSIAVLEAEPPKGRAEYAADSFDVHKEKSPEGATGQGVNTFNILNEESSEGAIEKMAGSCSLSLLNEESSEAGEALSNGRTPDSMLHSPAYKTQDGSKTQAIDKCKGSKTQAIDIVRGVLKKFKKSKNIDRGVINLKTNDHEEDLHAPECETMHPSGAMNGGDVHMEGPKSVSHAQGAMNGVHLGQDQDEPASATVNGMSRHTSLWHYVDPQGDSRGPFQLIELWEWKIGGFFDDSFKVWSTGQAKEHAILLTDAFRMNL